MGLTPAVKKLQISTFIIKMYKGWLTPAVKKLQISTFTIKMYRGADKSIARPTSRSILFDGKNISFDTSLVIYIYIYIYIYSINIPPIMIINRIYETQNLLSL